jgi:spore coat polysaccharide biosynthesis protein SpsF (cytidylyltransferase family)
VGSNPGRFKPKTQWYDDEIRFVLDQQADLDLYSASSQKQQSAGRHVAPLGHIILIPNQPVFALSP